MQVDFCRFVQCCGSLNTGLIALLPILPIDYENMIFVDLNSVNLCMGHFPVLFNAGFIMMHDASGSTRGIISDSRFPQIKKIGACLGSADQTANHTPTQRHS